MAAEAYEERQMKVSIIVPVYQVEKEIPDCIRSVLSQTLEDFECILVDDGSRDNSIKAATEIFGDDPRFRVIHKENGGLSDARNRGIEEAQGEYVFFLDSDDEIEPSLLEKTYSSAKRHDSDIVVFDMLYVWPDGKTDVTVSAEKEVSSYSNDPGIILINNSANNKLYRTAFIKDRRFPKGKWYEDLAVVPVWLAEANNVSYVPEPLYLYKQREGSISHSADPRIFDIYDSIQNIRDKLQLTDRDLSVLYYENCLIMTTLRIKEIGDRDMRLDYYARNIDLLEKAYPGWYEDLPKEKYSFKQRIVFWLLKHRYIKLLDRLYAK